MLVNTAVLGLARSRTGLAFIDALLKLLVLGRFTSCNAPVASFMAKSTSLGVQVRATLFKILAQLTTLDAIFNCFGGGGILSAFLFRVCQRSFALGGALTAVLFASRSCHHGMCGETQKRGSQGEHHFLHGTSPRFGRLIQVVN